MRYRVMKVVIFLLLLWMVIGFYGSKGKLPLTEAVVNELAEELKGAIYAMFVPGMAVGARESCIAWVVETQVETVLPLYGMAKRNVGYTVETSVAWEDDGHSKVLVYEELAEEDLQYLPTEQELQALMREENQAAQSYVTEFVPHGRQIQLRLEDYGNYESLVNKFYTIDANTMAGSDQLNLQALLSRDMTLQTKDEGPQILIYHTHSQEQFADSVPGDTSTSIVGVGERLTKILREQYGYQVLHHTGQYDVDTRDDAYGKSLPALEELLKEYPSIQVVIDLHRDEMAEGNRLVMDLDGRPTARFMFFNGLSRTKKSGNISYLENKNISDNLAFSFQMKLKCEEYYPGLTRKIYLKGYRYNMHLRPRSLLVELGAQNNTVEEAMNACDPLAHVLDMVLRGEDAQDTREN